MHRLIVERLEEVLRLSQRLPRDIESHLESCEECQAEIQQMQEHAALLQLLRAPESLEPRAGFYARVVERIDSQRQPSIWSIFQEPALRRLVATACMVVLVVAGAFLVSEETGAPDYLSEPEAIIATQERPHWGQDRERDRDTILVTLTTYRK